MPRAENSAPTEISRARFFGQTATSPSAESRVANSREGDSWCRRPGNRGHYRFWNLNLPSPSRPKFKSQPRNGGFSRTKGCDFAAFFARRARDCKAREHRESREFRVFNVAKLLRIALTFNSVSHVANRRTEWTAMHHGTFGRNGPPFRGSGIWKIFRYSGVEKRRKINFRG